MNYSNSNISPEVIFSHIWAIGSDARLAIMQQSLDSLIAEIGSPKIIPNNSTVIYLLINNHGSWFSMSCEGYAMSLAEKYEDRFHNLDFADLVLIVSLCYNSITNIERRHTNNLLKKYFRRKYSGYSESTMLFPEITSQTYGLLIYREQAEKLIMSITDMNYEEAKKLIRDLRKCDAKAHNYGDTFISLGEAKGLPKEKVRRVWALISRQAQLLTNYKFSLSLSWLLYQIQYLEIYYSNIVNKATRFAEQCEESLDVHNIEKINSLSLFSDINLHEYLWSKCKARLSKCLPESQFALFENVSSLSFRSSNLTLKISGPSFLERNETMNKIESFIPIVIPIFHEIYGADMKLIYEI